MLKVNDEVRVISECQSIGYIGKIKDFFYSGNKMCATVQFDRKTPSGNTTQSYNVDSLLLIREGEEMENIKCEMIDGYYIVEVKGSYNKKYSYKCRFEVNVGDKVVCEDENYIQTVVGVYNSDNAPYKNPTKEIVCVIDYSKINARKEYERLVAQIKRDLDYKVKQIQAKIDYEFYASKDSEVADLLKKLNELRGEK